MNNYYSNHDYFTIITVISISRSPPAMPYQLQNPKWPPGCPKMANRGWKQNYRKYTVQNFFSSSWSTSMTSTICFFKMVHLNDLHHLSLRAGPSQWPPGVEFCQGSNGTIRSSLATSYNVSRSHATSPYFAQSEARKLSHTDS